MGEKFEILIEKTGGWGKYQKIVVVLMNLVFLPIGFFIFAPVFTYYTPSHRCFIPEIDAINGTVTTGNLTGLGNYIPPEEDDATELSRCARYVKVSNASLTVDIAKTEGCLDGWVYMDPEGRLSVSTEFNLVCDDAWKKPVLTSGLMIGLFFGSIASGPITDKFGRRPSYLVNMVLHSSLCVVYSYVPSYELLLLTIVLIGTSHMIWYCSAFILTQELVDRKHRAMVSCLSNVIFAIGYALLPAVAYAIRDWRWIMRALGLSGVPLLTFIFVVPESPRWLMSKGRTIEALQIISRIAQVNGTNENVLDDLKLNNFKTTDKFLEPEPMKNSRTSRRKSSVEVLVTNAVMRRRSLLICWVWNVSFLCYYALGYNTSNLGGNNYWNCFIAAALEIPCFFFVTFAIQVFGRRNSVTSFIGLTGLFLGLSPVFAFEHAVSITLAMLGKFFAAATMGILFLYTSELYPTLLRSTGVGMASLSSRFGGVCAPFLVYVGESGYQYAPFYTMAGLGIITSVFCMFLPETKQSPLPDTIADAISLEKFRAISCNCVGSKHEEDEETEQDSEAIREINSSALLENGADV